MPGFIYDLFLGSLADPLWLESLDDLETASLHMKDHARTRPGSYFIYCSVSGRIVETIDTSSMPVRVLIVDDQENIRAILHKHLEAAGFDICGEAADGYDALDKAVALSPDVIVLDLCMPRMNGIEVACILRQRFSKATIIMLTMFDIGPTINPGAGIRKILGKQDGITKLIECLQGLSGVTRTTLPH